MSIGIKPDSGLAGVRNGVILPVSTSSIIIFGSCGDGAVAEVEELPKSIMKAEVLLSPKGGEEEEEEADKSFSSSSSIEDALLVSISLLERKDALGSTGTTATFPSSPLGYSVKGSIEVVKTCG